MSKLQKTINRAVGQAGLAGQNKIIIDRFTVQLLLIVQSFTINQLNIYFLSRAIEGLAL